MKTGHMKEEADDGTRSLSHLSPPHKKFIDYRCRGWWVTATGFSLQLTWLLEVQKSLVRVLYGVANEVVH